MPIFDQCWMASSRKSVSSRQKIYGDASSVSAWWLRVGDPLIHDNRSTECAVIGILDTLRSMNYVDRRACRRYLETLRRLGAMVLQLSDCRKHMAVYKHFLCAEHHYMQGNPQRWRPLVIDRIWHHSHAKAINTHALDNRSPSTTCSSWSKRQRS